jgi:hypothetical protein
MCTQGYVRQHINQLSMLFRRFQPPGDMSSRGIALSPRCVGVRMVEEGKHRLLFQAFETK